MGDVTISSPVQPAHGITSRQVDRGCGLHKKVGMGRTEHDLSGSASAERVVGPMASAGRVQSARMIYPEASSSDAGVALKLGTLAADDKFATQTSTISLSANDVETLDLDGADLTFAAGECIVFKNAGSKVGTGTVQVCIEYTLDDE